MKWTLMALLLLSQVLLLSCHLPTPAKSSAENLTDNTSQGQQPISQAENITLESGFDIPQGTVPERGPTYDDPFNCGPGIMTYRANCRQEGTIGLDYISEAKATLSCCKFAPRVTYRDDIETRSGQVRFNIFYMELLDTSLRESFFHQYVLTGTRLVDYSVRLAETVSDINVRNVGVHQVGIGANGGDEQIYLTIEIPPQIKSGDYTLRFIIEANGQSCGELPCVIHVIE